MRARRSGTVVQVSSMGGRLSFAGVGAYSASKFALEGLSEALAQEVAEYGIRVMVVEPGAFRTGFAGGGALSFSEPNPAYAATVGPFRTNLPDSDGSQLGDPDKAAAAILAALSADTPPFRLPLGSDAADVIGPQLEAARAEFRQWEATARSTDLEA
jgi:NAD(P)-dependent dehydrogenase (short-subunit alcohol dehydrogenase family)